MRFGRMLTILVALKLGSQATADVRMTSDVAGAGISAELHIGYTLLPQVFLAQDGDAPLFGGEFSLEVATGDLQIRAVTFNPAFSSVVGDEPALPNSSFTATRVQPLRNVNLSLGVGGPPVHFATVELEVLTDRPFESALIVKARGALVGVIPDATTVLGVTAGRGEFAEGRIAIVNRREQGSAEQESSGAGEQLSWTVEQMPAALEVRPAGGGAPVTTLAPDTEYRIYYSVPGSLGPSVPGINGFDLFVTTDGPPLGVGGSEAAGFDLCWEGAAVTELPGDGGEVRSAISADALSEFPVSGFEFQEEGVLCHFTTGATVPGFLGLDLRLYSTDPVERVVVEMRAQTEFIE